MKENRLYSSLYPWLYPSLYQWLVLVFVLGSCQAMGHQLSDAQLTERNDLASNEIDLGSIKKTFKKDFSKLINRKDCERKIFVKKAKLSIENNKLVVDLTARITRQYCTRRAKQQLYEKTNKIQFIYSLNIENGNLVLKRSPSTINKLKFEKALTDVMGKNANNKIAEVLMSLLGLDKKLSYHTLEVDSLEVGSDQISYKYRAKR